MLTWASRGLGALALAVLAVAFTPLPNALARTLEPAAVRKRADAIVVLGGDMNRDGTPGNDSVIRLVEGVRLYRHGFASVIALSGIGRDVEGRRALAVDLGVPPGVLVPIMGARSTQNEARLVAQRLRPSGARSVLLVTSGQHLPRARRLFEREGLIVFPVPVDLIAPSSGGPAGRLLLMRDVAEQLAARVYNAARSSL